MRVLLQLKCHKYWPEEGKPQFYGEIQVAMMSEHKLKHWTVREFTMQLVSEPLIEGYKPVKLGKNRMEKGGGGKKTRTIF